MFATLIIGLIVLIGLLAAVGRIRSKRPTRLIQTAPNAAVSLGIFGTFVGVYVGLLGFDVHDISASIPILLDGLKTAFMTSIGDWRYQLFCVSFLVVWTMWKTMGWCGLMNLV